jgi:uncharacterized protein DUF4291
MNDREIRADYDDATVVVYQAYRAEIALPAVRHNRFVPPFSLDRMSWIKPSFLWMMERSGWGRKTGQEYILAIRITRAGWDEALAQAVLTAFVPGFHQDHDDWQRQLAAAPVRVQWDPERTLHGERLSQRAIQVGLTRHIIPRYVDVWTREIRDCTPLVRQMYDLLHAGETERARALLPHERVYPVEAAVARRLGIG